MGKLKTEFTSPMAKSTSPVLSDTTFFCTLAQRLALFPLSLLLRVIEKSLIVFRNIQHGIIDVFLVCLSKLYSK